MNRKINKVAILGSGIMGSRIACHFANIGVEVILLDILPDKITEAEQKRGLTLESTEVRNRIANESLQKTLKAKPSPIYRKSFADKIACGNLEDNLSVVAEVDWVIEAVIENLQIKKGLYEKIDEIRKPGTFITTNTSGIPIAILTEGRSRDFQEQFCGVHFFNPPRYLRLVEIIPGEFTSKSLLEFLSSYCELNLGKKPILCKDTPAFIANRIGTFSIFSLFHLVEEQQLTVEEVDKLTGTAIGRAKSATFRTCDVVGLDTLVHVANDLYKNCPDDEFRDYLKLPKYVDEMLKMGMLGSKTAKGFYQKNIIKGSKEILSLDLKTLKYVAQKKVKFPSFDVALSSDDMATRIKILYNATDKAGSFYRASFNRLLYYVSNRIPEIADNILDIDDALNAGFLWQMGPFQIWDAIGVAEALKSIESDGLKVASWVYDMIKDGNTSFYKEGAGGERLYYCSLSRAYEMVPGQGKTINLSYITDEKKIWENSGSVISDIGDGVINLEFRTKMNTIGAEVIEGINKAVEIGEKDFRGLVIGNEAENFSAGANIALVFMWAIDQEFDELDLAVRQFQNTMLNIRYSSIPVVAAPRGLSLGGACEVCLHSDSVVAGAETYMGLVEVGAGLIPAGGGTKEMVRRMSKEFRAEDIILPVIKEYFLTIASAKVSTSGYEAFDLKFMQAGRDSISINPDRLILMAKTKAIALAEQGYQRPYQKELIEVMGKSALGMLLAGIDSFKSGNYITEYDKVIAEKVAYVMCGGELSEPTKVSEQYLLDLEREAFLSLLGEKKTLERIKSILTTGKPLRN